MKKIISLILCVLMLAGCIAGAANVSFADTHGFLLGDADDDTEICSKDVLIIRKYIAGTISDKDIDILAADVFQGDGINNKDVLALRKCLAGAADLDGNNTDGEYKISTLTIGGKNISRYTVVTTSDNECMRNSAKMFRGYINDACGIYLNIANAPDENTYSIVFRFDTEDRYDLGVEGYHIEVLDNGDVDIVCGSMRGPLYAMYCFLEEYVGYRFLNGSKDLLTQSSGDIIYLYENERVDVSANVCVTDVPGFEYRAVAQGGTTSTNFASLRANAVDSAGSRSCTSAKWGWGLGTLYIHAHSYAYQMAGYDHIYDNEYLAAGRYEYTQPCLTSEETYEKIVDYNIKLLQERNSGGQYLNQTYTQISCSPNDNTDFCNCTNCKAVYAYEGSISGTVFRLANRVAEALEQYQPGIQIYTIAYWDARNPPKYTRPRDNVCVCFCFGGCNNHTYDHPEQCAEAGGNPRPMARDYAGNLLIHSNVDDMDYFYRWAELTNNIYIWYYSCNFSFYMAPAPNLFNVYEDFKTLAAAGIAGVYSEGCGPGYSFEFLRGYMVSRMLWNPFMSEEEYNELFNEYLEIYYGPGWEYIRQYIEMTEECSNLMGCWTNNFDRPWNMYSKPYFAEHYYEMAELFDRAIAATSDEDQLRRLYVCRLHCDYLGMSALFESDWQNGTQDMKDRYFARYKYLVETLDYYNVEVTSFGGNPSNCGCPFFPKSADDVRNPLTWVIEDFSGEWEFIGGRWV